MKTTKDLPKDLQKLLKKIETAVLDYENKSDGCCAFGFAVTTDNFMANIKWAGAYTSVKIIEVTP